jgi:acetylornithine deacetylase/succinyl-diaminopimelate desuccinylase-like protein
LDWELERTVSRLMQEAVELLNRLCRQPSISAQGAGVREMANLLAYEMEELEIKAELHETAGNPIVVGRAPGMAGRTLLFYNHYDVQPVDPVEEWESPPFKPTVREGRLYARGATDNKGNIVSRLMAVRALREMDNLPVEVKFLVEGEEEVGSPSLAPWVEQHRELLRAEGCVWEDTFRDDPDTATITLGNKGMCYVQLECVTADVDCHSSYAGIYPNAAWRLLEALASLRDRSGRLLVKGFEEGIAPPSPEDLELLSRLPPMDMQRRQRKLGLRWVPYHDGSEARRVHLTEPTCNLAGIQAGYVGEGSKTVIPRMATAKVDIRLVPDQDPGKVFEALMAHLREHGFEDVQVRLIHATYPSKSPPGHLSRVMEEAALAVYGRPAQVEPWGTGSTPQWIASRLLGMPTAATGIGVVGSNTHGPNENVRLEDLRKGILYMAEIIRRF